MTIPSGEQDLHISGAKTVEAGSYGHIHVSGKASVTGPVQCRSLHVSGAVAVTGDLTSIEEAAVSGDLTVKGKLTGQQGLKISGSVAVDEAVQTRDLVVSGKLSSNEGIQTDVLKVSGVVKGLSLEAGTASVSGEAHIRDRLTASQGIFSGCVTVEGDMAVQDLKIYLPVGKGESRIRHIESQKVFIGNSPNEGAGEYISGLLGRTRRGEVFADSIVSEGPVDLENTIAKEVRGADVIIRKGCRIDKVFYTNSLKVLQGAQVGEQNKI